uniref:U6 snRNA-associated Sm-like protein LSm8 n=1 Tax=Romanomermis culicivorax TaxID=13658 RepID=A0A915JS85_ROMCU
MISKCDRDSYIRRYVQFLTAMTSGIESFANKMISVITSDGRNIIQAGLLKGFDQTVNLILHDSYERVYSTQQGVEQVSLGLSLIRGDNVAVIGEIDEEIDRRLDFANIKAEPLLPIWNI